MKVELQPVSAEAAVANVQSGQRVFVHGAAATPTVLLDALVHQAQRLRDVELIHLHVDGQPEYASPRFKDAFKVSNLFVGANMRPYMGSENVDYLPMFLSEIPNMFRSGRRAPDVALLHVSEPDSHGYCSLGTSVDIARAAADSAETILAQINPNMPHTHGDGFIHCSRFTAAVRVDTPIPAYPSRDLTEIEKQIGVHVAELVEDGSTLQMGIGSIPDAVLASLSGFRHLGVHTEMFSDGLLPLLESGVADNSRKAVHPGKTVSGFLMGTRRLYDFVDNNPAVAMLDIGYVNDPSVIQRNPKVCAINSAVEIDLTGQICADSVGSRIISGVGGQMDFIRGASLSPGGKPIIALPSQSGAGQSKIVFQLQPGAGVVTTRAHAHFVVTEYGYADLYGKTLRERAKALIAIAHPAHRDKLQYELSRI